MAEVPIEDVAGRVLIDHALDALKHAYAPYSKFAVGSHVLFYRLIDDRIDVVRILHQRMDPEGIGKGLNDQFFQLKGIHILLPLGPHGGKGSTHGYG